MRDTQMRSGGGRRSHPPLFRHVGRRRMAATATQLRTAEGASMVVDLACADGALDAMRSEAIQFGLIMGAEMPLRYGRTRE